MRWYVACTDIDESQSAAEDRMRNETIALRESWTAPRCSRRSSAHRWRCKAFLATGGEGGADGRDGAHSGRDGTGKELVARAVHNRSRRASGAFIRVNCGGIRRRSSPPSCSGHERARLRARCSAASAASRPRTAAPSSWMKVGDLPRGAVSLLRVLQEREIERVGSSHPIAVDVRVLARRTAISRPRWSVHVPGGSVLPAQRLPIPPAAAA